MIEAKTELSSGDFRILLKKLLFNGSTAKKLICIAKNALLSSHVNSLPPCYTTLYHLSQVPERVLEDAFEDGTIHPGMSRKDAAALKPAKKTTARPATANASKITPFARYATGKLHSVLACAEQPNDENIKRMLAMLNCIIKNAEAKGLTRSDIVIAEGEPKGRCK